MKKVILIIWIASLTLAMTAYAQDSYLDIGNLRIRYDSDSNMVRFGKRPVTVIGNLRIAKEFNSQLFDFNTAQFTWSSSTGLNLNNNILSQDSSAFKIMSIKKDSTWLNLGEPLSKWRVYSLKKTFWANPIDGRHNLKWYYRSINEMGELVGSDSAYVINHTFTKYNNEQTALSGTYAQKDTLIIQDGCYLINYGLTYQFVDATSGGLPSQDTIYMALYDIAGDFIIPNSEVYVTHTYSSTTSGTTGIMNWNIAYKITGSTGILLLAKGITSNALIHFAHKDNLTATLVN